VVPQETQVLPAMLEIPVVQEIQETMEPAAALDIPVLVE
jgi:hypothetical protein